MLDALFASFWQSVLIIAVIHIVMGALFGAALATWTRFPLWLGILLGVVTPVVGPVTAAIVVTARRTPDETLLARPRRLRVNAVVIAVPALAMLATLLFPWWIVQIEGSPRLPLFPTGNFLDTVIVVSAIVLAAVCVLVATLGMVHLGAALLTALLAFWAFALCALGAVTKGAQDMLTGVAGLSVSLGDLLRFFGVEPGSLPLDELGIDGENVDLTDIAGAASVEFGSGWYLMIAAVVVLTAWVAWAAFVPARRGVSADEGTAAEVASGAEVRSAATAGPAGAAGLAGVAAAGPAGAALGSSWSSWQVGASAGQAASGIQDRAVPGSPGSVTAGSASATSAAAAEPSAPTPRWGQAVGSQWDLAPGSQAGQLPGQTPAAPIADVWTAPQTASNNAEQNAVQATGSPWDAAKSGPPEAPGPRPADNKNNWWDTP